MPSWLASRMVTILIEKSYTGWQASLAVHRIHVIHELQTRKTMEMLLSDDKYAMHQAFERRQIGPRDRFLNTNGDECTLSQLALLFGAWRISNHLLSLLHDTLERPPFGINWQRRVLDEERLHELQTLVKRDNFGVHVRFQLLGNFDGNLLAFDSIRRQIWSDDHFYSDSFRNHRIQFAWFLAISANAMAPTFFRHALSPHGILRARDMYTGRLHLGYWDDTLLHALALGVGSAALHGQETSKKWALVASEVLPLVDNYHELAPVAAGDKFRTPLFASLFISLIPWPTPKAQNRSRNVSLSKRLQHMETGIKAWLQVLKDAGVNLQEYGERERELFNLESYERGFQMYSGEEVSWCDYLRRDLVLIGFQHGQEVNDWKLWWSEHTDVYAGDFWNLIESSVGSSDQRVPGAWVEDQESEIIQMSGTVGESCSDKTTTDACAMQY
ncbi:hypothetical protein PFICI_12131 [Pestalotiopsis fici W106-1]|uniref:Uncharacterized protein n=1 Tax=Pestalotiopsis fici (strain W106-1 / CGMCC3.15140) TaxID=1229662 RepID=W3WSH0_PESFW|nr:uncharacterized protein PFICI_12131 [Pestalotiopsis fici W106-1]ETS76744.1 hypothetical protein PFICI_12131 [Pestalotiopsis fici W106-1]